MLRVSERKYGMSGNRAKKRVVATWVAVLILSIGGFAASSLAAPDSERATRFVRAGLDEAISILGEENASRPERIERLRNLLRRDFDIDTVGKFALGIHRRDLSGAKLAIYLQAFEDHIVEAYVKRMVRLVEPAAARSANDYVRFVGTQPAGSRDIFVRMTFGRPGQDPLEVNWRVRERGGRLRIIDVNILGVSMAMTYRQEFVSVISQRGDGVDGLISALREHSTDVRLGGE